MVLNYQKASFIVEEKTVSLNVQIEILQLIFGQVVWIVFSSTDQ